MVALYSLPLVEGSKNHLYFSGSKVLLTQKNFIKRLFEGKILGISEVFIKTSILYPKSPYARKKETTNLFFKISY